MANEENVSTWFTDTGIEVKNHKDLVYHIVKDKNGWLYYTKIPEGTLEPVIDAEGNRTKDISIFLESN